jgi:hypothetical protein
VQNVVVQFMVGDTVRVMAFAGLWGQWQFYFSDLCVVFCFEFGVYIIPV